MHADVNSNLGVTDWADGVGRCIKTIKKGHINDEGRESIQKCHVIILLLTKNHSLLGHAGHIVSEKTHTKAGRILVCFHLILEYAS